MNHGILSCMDKRIEMRIKGNALHGCSWKRIIYTLCFFMFCVIDQRVKTCSGLDGWLETFRNLTGVVMAILIMSHYKVQDFIKWKIPYLIWTFIGGAVGIIAFCWGLGNRPFLNEWLVSILDVILFGYILIHTAISVLWEKKWPALDKKITGVWLAMMLLMVFSRSDYIWPICYLVMFGCFYLTDYTKEEQEDLFQGALNGIILGFFILQGLCFVFRPYDRVRYQGIYHNANLNSLFYLMVLVAVLGKILYVTKHALCKWVKIYYWLGAGATLAFIFLSIGRTAWVTSFFLVISFLWHLKKIGMGNKIIKNGIILVLCMCLMFPLCFSAARYLPPVFHHPVWFWGEWGEERVHSWDPWNSDKYVNIDDFFRGVLGRFYDSFESLLGNSPFAMKAEAAEHNEMSGGVPNVTEYVLKPEQGNDSLLIRIIIYKHYFSNLNLFGHKQNEQGFQLVPFSWIGHAHNIFLQYGTDFGIFVMILLVILTVWTVIKSMILFAKRGSVCAATFGLFFEVPVLFGSLEYSWGTGSLCIIMMFVVWRELFLKEEGLC